MTTVNNESSAPVEETAATNMLKFCPICGDTMHQETYLGSLWWFCDDAEGCGFFEPVK